MTRTATTTARTATEKQVAFINRLRADQAIPRIQDSNPEFFTEDGTPAPAFTTAAASREIDFLLSLPKPAPKAQAAAGADVPAGRYALDIGGHVHFYRVDRPTEGKWAGWTFVKRQSGDNEDRIRGGEAQEILSLIAHDPGAAMLRYGVELGICGHCGRSLTDAESRARGIGPVCAVNLGI